LQPALGFVRPDYLRNDSIVRRISWWLIVRPAWTSARPRSTIAAKASSLNELFERTVVRLLVDHPPELVLGRGRGTHPPIVAPEADRAKLLSVVPPFLDVEALDWPLLDRGLPMSDRAA
jgi:hypothetical protein